MRTGTWDMEMCKKLGIPESFLSDIYECSEVVGGVSEKAAKENRPVRRNTRWLPEHWMQHAERLAQVSSIQERRRNRAVRQAE